MPRKPTFQPASVTSSRMVRACSATASASISCWSKISAVSRITMLVTTGSACAPIAAMVAMSPASPPAPLGSLALKHITQAGGASVAGPSGSVAGMVSGVMGEGVGVRIGVRDWRGRTPPDL